jgi:hypothetical protein
VLGLTEGGLMPVAGQLGGSGAGDQVAVFIDLENLAIGAGETMPGQTDTVPFKALELLCRDYGNTSIRRAYADWSRPEFAKHQFNLARKPAARTRKNQSTRPPGSNS